MKFINYNKIRLWHFMLPAAEPAALHCTTHFQQATHTLANCFLNPGRSWAIFETGAVVSWLLCGSMSLIPFHHIFHGMKWRRGPFNASWGLWGLGHTDQCTVSRNAGESGDWRSSCTSALANLLYHSRLRLSLSYDFMLLFSESISINFLLSHFHSEFLNVTKSHCCLSILEC